MRFTNQRPTGLRSGRSLGQTVHVRPALSRFGASPMALTLVAATLPLGGSDVSASGEGPLPSGSCIPRALQPSPRLGSTLPKGGWHNDSPS